MERGFHWFVAWRYLMARPRKWSLPALIGAAVQFAAALILVGIGLFVVAQPDPTDPFVTGSPYRQDLFLAAVGCAVGAELWLVVAFVRRYFTFFTTVSIAGTGIGTMALVIVLSVMSGFETDLRDKILGFNAHVLVTKDEGELTEYRDVAAVIARDPAVVAHTPYVTSEVVIAANNNYANVIIKGVDPRTVSHVTDLEKNVRVREKVDGRPRTRDEKRAAQRQAMQALWPLYEDGGVRSGPLAPDEQPFPELGGADAGLGPDASDPAPPDLELGGPDLPPDLSGALRPAQDARAEDAGVPGPDPGARAEDPPPGDLDVGDVGDPIDLSGGKEPPTGDTGDDPDDDDLVAGTDGGVPIIGPFGVPLDLEDEPPPPRIMPRVALLPGVLVGQELVKQLHLYTGQEVRIVSPLGEMTPQGKTFYTRFYRVAGRFYTGMYEYDLKFVYVDMASLQAFLNLGDQANGIEVRVKDPERTEVVRKRLAAALGPDYRVQDWKELNRNLFSALKLEKIAMFLVLGIIILVASFSIIGNLIMVVIEKAKEIALVKTLGASNGGVMQIFVTQGFFIGLVGTVLGVTHGLVLAYLGGRFGLPLDPDVYYIDRLPIHIEPMSVVAVAIAGVSISVLATLYPAYMAARLRPAEGMRYE